MRTYPKNSPEAAARLVALTLIADGVAHAREVEAWQSTRMARALGLPTDRAQALLQQLCEDLLASENRQWGRACHLDDSTLDSVLDEVDDPLLRERVLQAAIEVAEADGHLSDSESRLLARAAQRWGVHPVVLMPGTPLARAA
ncbi:TerB family tellurite resistance protein [Inhella crocodyli]|uniref:TerB family tellurite resistance protein n=1 Tax=Inhella crocodyli TaxID=2499851 RepID=A0A437LRI4_9BURK|nr:TerB family tellurite resistance protein [Inhella crocodyli]RVT88042.1 TerB family tellurite resistance protein [Inhella crocodyli]